MKVGTILLTIDNKYIDEDGNLPIRPEFDKELLTTLVKGRSVSLAGFNMLPPSIRREINPRANEVAITIKELAECDLLIVSRSPGTCKLGKIFRLDKFKQFGSGNPEIWFKI